jgi:hypothetical protein
MLFCGVSDPAEQASALKYTHVCHCSAGSDTPQDLVLRGLIPAEFCSVGSGTSQDFVLRVSDPTGKLRPRRIRRKSFESLPFSLKGNFSKIVCMYKLHYPRLIVSMFKEPLSLKWIFVLWGMIPAECIVKCKKNLGHCNSECTYIHIYRTITTFEFKFSCQVWYFIPYVLFYCF